MKSCLIFPLLIAVSIFELAHAGNEFMDEARAIIVEEIFEEPKTCVEILANDPELTDLKESAFAEIVRNKCEAKVKDSYLGNLTHQQRTDLCAAIRSRNPVAGVTFKDQGEKVEEAQLYEIRRPTANGKEGRVAIKCPFSPPAYALFEDPRQNGNILMMYVGKRWT